MSDSSAFGFGKFIPGFDFLQNLGKTGQGGALPPFSHWVAPTMSVEEIDKRIEELKAVQFWLEQNNRALNATVQALQVQKMTLSTLKSMNVNLNDLSKAFPFAAASAAGTAAAPTTGNLTDWPMSGAPEAPPAPAPEPQPAAPDLAGAHAGQDTATQAANMATAMQWWGALTQQFQHIAQQTMQDPAQQQAMIKATQMGSDFAKVAVKTAGDMVRQAVAQSKPAAAAKAATGAKAATAAKPAAPRKAQAPASKATSARKPAAKRSSAPAKKAVSGAASGDRPPAAGAARASGATAKPPAASKPRGR